MRSTTPTRATRPLVAFCLALLVMVTLHALAHAVAALAIGLHPVVHRGSVDTGAGPGPLAERVDADEPRSAPAPAGRSATASSYFLPRGA